MRKHRAFCALACALIVTLPPMLSAQTPASAPAPSSTSASEMTQWGPFARLAGQTMKHVEPSGYRLRWRWETPGEVLLEEWYQDDTDLAKPIYTGTYRRGAEPGTLVLKSSAMLGKEWVGTVAADGSVSFVGRGLLKMPYTVRIDEQGRYEMANSKGRNILRYAAITDEATPIAVTDTSNPASTPLAAASISKPVATTAPTAPVPVEKPAVAVAQQQNSPAPPQIRLPRRLSPADLARIEQSVRKSRELSIEEARRAVLAQQEANRKWQLEWEAIKAQNARIEAENAAADAEFEAERAQRAAEWQQNRQASEQALADSMQRLNDTTARIQAQQAEAQARQRAQSDAIAQAERQRQVELIRQANQRQEDEAARLAAQRQQYEQQRADAQAADRARELQRGAGDAIAAGHASTDTDANRCVSGADVRENDTTKGNTAAYVTNGCGVPIDVKVCLMTDSGWKCGVTWGLASQGSWSFSAFHASGGTFVDAKVAGSSKPLASPN